MKITTALDLEKHTATVIISTDEKDYKMIYNLDEVVAKLEAISGNIVTQKMAELMGFRVEVENRHAKKT